MFWYLITISFALLLSIYVQANWLRHLLRSLFPDVLWSVSTHRRMVALTLDDAPSENTHTILNILNRYSARATFFILGEEARKRPHLLQAIVEQGSELGNHTMTDERSVSLDKERFKDSVQSCHQIIAKYQPNALFRWFRPGCGWFTSSMIRRIRKLGYDMALGDVYPFDPIVASAYINSQHIIHRVHPGAIIILHDNRKWTIETLELVLHDLVTVQGYQVVTLTQLMMEA